MARGRWRRRMPCAQVPRWRWRRPASTCELPRRLVRLLRWLRGMRQLTLLLACASFGFLAACDSGNGSARPGPDATPDTALEAGSEGTTPDARNDGFDDGPGDAPVSETGPDAPADALSEATRDATADADTDAGPCTAPLEAFGCPATYPAVLSNACTGANGVITAAPCGSLVAVIQGGRPHYSFCLYEGVDAGALVGTQRVTDNDEYCNVLTGGQVPATCNDQILTYLDPGGYPDSGSITVPCDGGAGPGDATVE
jgi:hypothetical protein